MIQLASLLIGGRALRRRWWVLALVGALFLAAGAAIIADASDGTMMVATQVFGLVFLLEGILALFRVAAAPSFAARCLSGTAALLLAVLGVLIMDTPLHSDRLLAWLFGTGLAGDGLLRLATVAVVRFRRWPAIAAGGGLELVLAALIATDWPLPDALNIPLCISLLLLLSGARIARVAWLLKRAPEEMALLGLPVFGTRDWYENAPVLVGEDQPDAAALSVLTVRVWTPVGSAEVAARRPVVDRYLGAVDIHGAISTGHSALECLPHVYISHWPGQEIDQAHARLGRLLRAGAENDIPGLFQPSYAEESALWCPADEKVEFHRFHARSLRAYWAGYRQDSTYNLTNRNCSVAVAAGLDSALEGVLGDRFPLLRFALLLVNPHLWTAAFIRSHAQAMSWTPGLVLDYAQALTRIIDTAHTPVRALAAALTRRPRQEETAP